MRVLGLSYGFHDSACALLVDGQLVAAASEERMTRQKHDAYFPQFAIAECLHQADLRTTDLDCVVFYESPPQKFSRVLQSALQRWPRQRQEFVEGMTSWLGQKLWTVNQIAYRLHVSPQKVLTMRHHEAHAYQAFVGSGFEDAGILTIDSVGEWNTTGLWQAAWQQGRPHIQALSLSEYPHSLGLFYSAMTAFLGFQPMNDECTTMALAAFGQPKYKDFLSQIMQVQDGRVHLAPGYLNFDSWFSSPFQPALIKELGLPRSTQEKLPFSSFGSESVNPEQQRFADIAASVQLVFEECVLQLSCDLKAKTKSKNLCYAGGAALNCLANTRLQAEWDQLFVPVDPGDGGAALGAAFYGHFQSSQAIPKQFHYLENLTPRGNSACSLGDVARNIRIQGVKKFAVSSQSDVQSWQTQDCNSEQELIEVATAEVAQGKVVGWFQGNAEFGPRALGHRSIFIRPDRVDLAERLSARIKERAPFRPYALSLREENFLKIFVHSKNLNQRPLEWMQVVGTVRADYQSQVRAGLHIDGTTRPQVVRAHRSPLFYKLLKKFEEQTGIPALLNTSFNESGYPIVRTPLEALLMFARTDMDTLIVDNTVLRKVRMRDA